MSSLENFSISSRILFNCLLLSHVIAISHIKNVIVATSKIIFIWPSVVDKNCANFSIMPFYQTRVVKNKHLQKNKYYFIRLYKIYFILRHIWQIQGILCDVKSMDKNWLVLFRKLVMCGPFLLCGRSDFYDPLFGRFL